MNTLRFNLKVQGSVPPKTKKRFKKWMKRLFIGIIVFTILLFGVLCWRHMQLSDLSISVTIIV